MSFHEFREEFDSQLVLRTIAELKRRIQKLEALIGQHQIDLENAGATSMIQHGNSWHDTYFSKFSTGSYVGDGTDDFSKEITISPSFQPRMIWIFQHYTGNFTAPRMVMSHENMGGTDACIVFYNNEIWYYRLDRVRILNDGFAVSDVAADAEPNQDGITYDYVVWG